MNYEVSLKIFLCLFISVHVQAQVTFHPDPEEDVQLQVTILQPPVEVTTVQCYPFSPIFKIEYAMVDDSQAVYIIDFHGDKGHTLNGSTCALGQNQYRVKLANLVFTADPLLVGRSFKLKVSLDGNEENSTVSRRIYTFPAPFNLTGSSLIAVRNSSFTWTCHVTSDYPIIEWIQDSTTLVQMGIHPNGSCVTFGQNDPYTYSCQMPDLTYILKIPKSSLTEEVQATAWRCKHVTKEVIRLSDLSFLCDQPKCFTICCIRADIEFAYNCCKGSQFMACHITCIIPVTKVTIYPGSGSTLDADENNLVTFTCITNKAYPPPSLLWYTGSSDVMTLAGSNRTTLTLNVTRENDQKKVQCKAWNSENTAYFSDSTTLNVRVPPADNEELQIMGYSSGQVMYEDNKTMISIYCKQPGGNPVVNMTFTCGSRTGTNENTATEAIRRLNLTIDRNLNRNPCVCISTHVNGYMRRKSVSFNVYYPPSAPTISPSSAFPWKAPGSYSLTCSTVPGNPADTTYSWKEGGLVLPITSQIYEINSLQKNDNGRELYCTVSNNFTLQEKLVLTSSITALTVEYDPVVTLDQSSMEVVEGHSAVLSCSATGNPAPDVTWYRGSTPVTGSTISASTYTSVNISRTSAGNYTCRASSSSTGSNVMEPDQKTLYLRVFYPPTMSLSIQNTTEDTEDHTIKCSALGDPNNATFAPLQQRIGPISIRNITSLTKSSPGHISYTIERVSYQDMGTYTCLASNGIPDGSDQTVQSDTKYFNVITSAKFETMHYTMIADIDKPTVISIPFYRNPPADVSDMVWTNYTGSTNEPLESSSNVFLSLSDTDIKQTFYGVNVTVRAQSAVMNITSFQKYYEGNYTLKIRSNPTDSEEVIILLTGRHCVMGQPNISLSHSASS